MTKFLILTLILISCSSKDKNLLETDLWARAYKVEPGIVVVLPKELGQEVVVCSDYPKGCTRGRQIRVKNVAMNVVEFENEKLAQRAAIILKQYYHRNWIFDDVSGEPILEEFVKKAFNAVKPSLPAEQQSEPAKF